jgi:hypothetical protein
LGVFGRIRPRDYSAAPLSAEGVYAVIVALFTQVVMVLAVERLTDYRVDFKRSGFSHWARPTST